MILVAKRFATKKLFKWHFDKQISTNLQRKNVYGGIRQPEVACNNKVTLALLVASLTF